MNVLTANHRSAPRTSIATCRSLIGLLVSGLLIGSAAPVHAGTLISSTSDLSYELPAELQTRCATHDNCPDIAIEYLDTNHRWINDSVNTRINESITDSKITKPAAIKAALDDFAHSQFIDDPEGRSWAYRLNAAPKYLGHVRDFELFDITAQVFTGGAHGMSYGEYLVFDLKTKKQRKLDDMLLSGKKPAFTTLAYAAYQAWISTVCADANNYEKDWPFTLSEDITLTDTGIDIRYQHYAIGPYAHGMPVLSIPYSQLEGIIKPRFIAPRSPDFTRMSDHTAQ